MAKAATKTAPKGKATTAAAAAGAGARLKNSLIPLKTRALSTDVGPRVIAELFRGEARANELTQEIHELKGRNRQQLAELTLAIIKAARADDIIDLSSAFVGDPKLWGKTLNQLAVATGFRTVVAGPVDKEGKSTEICITSQAVKDFFPMADENAKNTPNYNVKVNFSKNFLTQFKKCAQAAHGVIERNMEAKLDKTAGTLVISGAEVKKHFGQERVLLDERKVIGSGDAAVELSEKPSFQALANIGSTAAGAGTVQAGSAGNNTRGTQAGTVAGAQASSAVSAVTAQQAGKLAPEKAVIAICDSLKKALETFKGKMTEKMEDALNECANAIDAFTNKEEE